MQMKVYIILFVFILLSSISFGITFRNYDMSTGLSHNSILCVTQTRDGFIWIGTRDGLCRFNGISYTVYKQNFDDQNSISNNSINCIYEASNGDLWIGTTMGLNRYSPDSEAFEKYSMQPDGKGISHNYIRSIAETNDGTILIGTPFGIDRYDSIANAFRGIPIGKSTAGKDNSVTCFYKDRKNRIWVGLRSGLYLFETDRLKRVFMDEKQELKHDNFEIRDIKEDSGGKVWVATEEFGIFSFNYLENKAVMPQNFQVGNSRIVSNHVRKIFMHQDEIWLGTMEGLSIFKPKDQTVTNYQYSATVPDGISNNSIRDIFGDDSGGIWLATYAGGINYYHPQNNLFSQFRMTTGKDNFLTSNVISGFLEEDNGDLWIATEGGGLVFREFSGNTSKTYTFQEHKNSLVHNNVKSLTHDRAGNVWIGTYNGLSCLTKRTGFFTNYQNQPGTKNSLVNNQVHSVLVDENNNVWIGTNGGGVQTFDPATGLFTALSGVAAKNVNVMMSGKQDRLWIGHQGGLACLDRKSLKNIDISYLLNQLPFTVQYVQCLHEDHLGRIWIGTQGFGLFLIQDDQMVWFNTEKGLPDNTINAFVEDEKGNFWFTSNKGISRFSYPDTSRKNPSLVVKTYTKGQGLQGFQYLPMSFLKSKTGSVFFGGVNGFNVFQPDKIDDHDFSPRLIFTDLRVRSDTKEGTTHWPLRDPGQAGIRLSYRFRDISVDFLGINYIDPDNTLYRYQLLDIDKEWVSLGTQRTINFNYLPAGHYELRVQATTNEASWGTSYESLILEIRPPWWLTGWAFTGYFVLLILLLSVFFRLSKRWANLNNQLAMEHFQREKEEELHQLKLKFFTDVSHELRTPLTLIVSPLEQIIKQPDLNSRLHNQLTLIQQNGNRMMRLINKVLDLRRLEAGYEKLKVAPGDLVKFMQETSLAFKETARIKNIAFEFVTGESSLELYFDRDKMEMILYNLLSNAIKNTLTNGRIVLELKRADPELTGNDRKVHDGNQAYAEISVTDNGRGIPGELLGRIFERFFVSGAKEKRLPLDSGVGLELTKRLVELHKGHISVDSQVRTPEKDGFTRFSLLFPLGKDHLSDDEIETDFKNSEDSTLYTSFLQEDELMDFSGLAEQAGQADPWPDESGEKINLLIVEDNSEVRSFIKSLFAGPYQVEEAENGKIGWDMATRQVPDLIICDIMMPEMDGMELCRKIKTDIRTSHIPVILLTARTAITFKYEGLETGADDYITKPFSAGYLQLRVRNLIHQRELLRNHFSREGIFDPARITVTSVDEKLLKKAVEYIGEHMADSSLSVEKLSSELGLSRVHLYRKIKALTKLTAVEFIRSIRLKRAASLLQENKLNINEVSFRVGFEDVDYFRNCFRQQYGCSPSDYSKKFRNETQQ